jgi:hypothetical protein
VKFQKTFLWNTLTLAASSLSMDLTLLTQVEGACFHHGVSHQISLEITG